MLLRELSAALPGARVVGPAAADLAIENVVLRADRAEPGSLFCALRGSGADGHDYAAQAVARGAAALLVERPLPELGVPQVVVADSRLACGLAAAAAAGHPSQRLRVVGVTGTNGKTTCTVLAAAVLEAAGHRCGLIGTIETRVGGRRADATHTTPDAVAVQGLLSRMVAAGDTACAMEVSSHALDQRRVAGTDFAAALFTNLTHDHLDYHGDLESYFLAKRRLFMRPSEEGVTPPGAANLDDPHGRRLVDELGLVGYAVRADAPVRPRRVEGISTGIAATIATPRGDLDVTTHLRGPFNLSNIAATVALGELLELPHAAVAAGLGAVAGVPGRFEPVVAGQPFTVIVDYAHTPDAVENVLDAARALVAPGGRLIVAVGCGGDRDRAKRGPMGAAARRRADVAIITSDNPRSEDPEAIIAQIVAGAEGPGELRVEPDRRAAIALAVGLAGVGDVVVIAGKGHEQGQEVAGVVTPFDDRAVARQILRGLE